MSDGFHNIDTKSPSASGDAWRAANPTDFVIQRNEYFWTGGGVARGGWTDKLEDAQLYRKPQAVLALNKGRQHGGWRGARIRKVMRHAGQLHLDPDFAPYTGGRQGAYANRGTQTRRRLETYPQRTPRTRREPIGDVAATATQPAATIEATLSNYRAARDLYVDCAKELQEKLAWMQEQVDEDLEKFNLA